MTKLSTLIGALASAVAVSAHGHVSHVIHKGVQFRGYHPASDPYSSNPPVAVGWAADQLDLGFVAPDAYGTPDMICHRSATPAKGHVRVAAGDTLTLQWNTWPESHHGPISDWLAPCNGPCANVDKNSLRFFKITGQGLIRPGAPGYYAADQLIDNDFAWVVKIPENIAPGHYVLRHEIIALHGASGPNGAQSYPQCFNLEITGSGTAKPAGVSGTALYGANDPGVLVNIYDAGLDYKVPGGAFIQGGVSAAPQNPEKATATGTPTTVGGSGPQPTVNPPSSTNPPATTLVTKTTTAPGTGPTQSPWGQCGGIGWSGPTVCGSGTRCVVVNDYYHQCQ
ncbi:related to Polysaccharide monooxygenase Cel61a [Cephalotrichum gorgonifer]|uniref:lytic cellulose monooxygenase (C4-dehydrogenating) n=1 Tax=Cephalotrichum gorgonifer TaxID=2041049 RepID=A0AAE8MUE0_9PEZI|nr:related to Polysaccharide monooxygenase Cel61a [Cephalotrichum gorgonifer]